MQPIDKYNSRVGKVGSLLCVGLDSELAKLSDKFKMVAFPQFQFNKWIIEQTHEFVSAYKINIAFYEQHGDKGLKELKMTMDYLVGNYPDIFTICDAKRGDIGNTNRGYVEEIFDWLRFDAVTLHPYMGKESLEPFLARKDKMNFILCRTSNPGAGEFQSLSGRTAGSEEAVRPLWEIVAEHVKDWGDNCGLVVATDFNKVREIAGDMPFLVPGIGAQGGSVEEAVKGGNVIINSSRGIIFAENPKDEAKK